MESVAAATLAPPLAVRGHLSGWALVRQVDWRTLCSELLHWLTTMECPGPVPGADTSLGGHLYAKVNGAPKTRSYSTG